MNWYERVNNFVLLGMSIAALTLGSGLALAANPNGEQLFKSQCASCHSIGGGKLVGPDLKGASKRQSHEWLVNFVLNPQKVINSGDAYAKKILAESNGIVMPQLPGLDASSVNAILDYVDAQSGVAAEQSADTGVDWSFFTPAMVEQGRALFSGHERFEQGGPPCFSCHSSPGASWAASGNLGPNLAGVYKRLGEARGLQAWLTNPPSQVMQVAYQDKGLTETEVAAMTAFFTEYSEREHSANATATTLTLVLFGVFGCGAMLGVFDLAWINRFRKVRELLIEKSRITKGHRS